MKSTTYLALISFFFLQTAIGQDINYREITRIIVGDDYEAEDVEILKEEIVNGNKQKDMLKFLNLNKYLSKKVDIGGREIPKACADSYSAKQKNKATREKLFTEVTQLKKEYEKIKASNSQIKALNDKINKYNTLNVQLNVAIENLKLCLVTQREVEKDYDKIFDDLYNAYNIRKSNTIVITN